MAGERSQFMNLYVDTETAFGVLNGAPFPAGSQLAAWNLKVSPDQEALEDASVRVQRGSNPRIPGSKKASALGFDVYATGLGTAATGAAAQTALGKILKAGIGTEDLDTGTTSASPGAGTAAAPIIADVTNISSDNVCGFVLGGSYGTVWRHVESNAAGTLTLSYALPTAPTPLNVVYACANYRMVDQLVEASSLQYRILNETSDREFDFYGCFPNSLSIARTVPGQIAVLSVGNVCSSWTDDPAVVTTALANPTLPAKAPWMDSQCEIWPWNAAPVAYNATYRRAVRGLAINYTNGLVARPDPHGVQGLSMWDTDGANPLSVEVGFQPDDNWPDSFTAGTYYSMIVTFGRTAGKVFGVYVRKMHIPVIPGYPVDDGGVLSDSVTFELAQDSLLPPVVVFQG